MGKRTVQQVINEYGEQARSKLTPLFINKGIHYPPNQIALIAFKANKRLELWAANKNQSYTLITHFPIQAASGKLGPKLREGDKQVPEGIYKITGLNPNSAYHLSMKLNYPNNFDLQKAKQEGRTEPGSNIFIHGKASSVGCLAIGDAAIEQLFTLVHDTGREQATVLISPTSPANSPLKLPAQAPEWTDELYRQITNQYQAITQIKNTI